MAALLEPKDARTLGPLELRPARTADLDAVLEVERASYPQPWSAEAWREEFDATDRVTLVAVAEGGAVRGVASALVAAGEAQVTTVAVAPSARRCGVGSQLLTALLDGALAAGAIDVTLEVRESDAGAQALYSGFGFVSEGVRPGYYQDNGEGAVIMWLRDLPRWKATSCS